MYEDTLDDVMDGEDENGNGNEEEEIEGADDG